MTVRVRLAEKLASFDDAWNPRIVADVNDHEVRVVKLRGEFVWHTHADTDELFYVVAGAMRIELRDRVIELAPGDLYVVPKDIEHRSIAPKEAQVLVLERKGTRTTGDHPEDPRTRTTFSRI